MNHFLLYRKITLKAEQGYTSIHRNFCKESEDFPGGAVVKNPPAYAGDTGSSPGPGRSHMPRSN